jgi:hypothetical protein
MGLLGDQTPDKQTLDASMGEVEGRKLTIAAIPPAPRISRGERLDFDDEFGGASRDRTDGLVVANDALSQLSYSPILKGWIMNR